MSQTIPNETVRAAGDTAPQLTVRSRSDRRADSPAGRTLVRDATPQRRRGEAFATVKQRLSW